MGLCFGTHNEHSTNLILQLMKQKGIENNDKRIYFSQLLGMSDNISFYLAYFNYNVAKYVPYTFIIGPFVLPVVGIPVAPCGFVASLKSNSPCPCMFTL